MRSYVKWRQFRLHWNYSKRYSYYLLQDYLDPHEEAAAVAAVIAVVVVGVAAAVAATIGIELDYSVF